MSHEKNSSWFASLSKRATELFSDGAVLAISFITQFTFTNGQQHPAYNFNAPNATSPSKLSCSDDSVTTQYTELLQSNCNTTAASPASQYEYSQKYGTSGVVGETVCTLFYNGPMNSCVNTTLDKIKNGTFISDDATVIFLAAFGGAILLAGATIGLCLFKRKRNNPEKEKLISRSRTLAEESIDQEAEDIRHGGENYNRVAEH
jgi:hypothetical protein